MKKIKCLDWLRTIAMFMIIYDHLCALRNPDYVLVRVVDGLFNQPLQLVQYFGALGVGIFFLISGFLLSSTQESPIIFIYKKIIRILVPLITTIGLFFIFNKCISLVGGITYWDSFEIRDWLECAFLSCYLRGTETAINGAVWYLFPLMTLYILYAVFARIVKKNNLLFVVLVDGIFLLLFIAKGLGWNPITQMRLLIFVLMPLFGMIIRAAYDEKIHIKTFLSLMLIQYIIFVIGIKAFREEYYSSQPYINSCLYAILIFILGLLIEKQLTLPKSVQWLSKVSYDVYLVHMTFGALIMTAFEHFKIPFTLCLLVGISASFVVAWLHYQKIEKPLGALLLKKVLSLR